MIGFIGKIRRRMPLGWLQLSRHKGRFLVAISGVAFADLLMFMQLGFQSALFNSATRLHKSLQGDIVIFSTQARNLTDMSTFTRRRLYQAMNVPGVKSVDAIYTNTIKWKNPLTRNRNNLLIVGFDPDQQVFNIPEINTQLQKTKLPDTLLLDTKTRGEYTEVISQIQQGKTVTTEVERRTVTISGLFTVGSSFGSDGHLMTSDQNFLRLFPRREAASISLGLINLKPGHDLEVVTNALKNHLPQDDINAHIKEYATFKAMGYRNIYLLGIVFEEAFILVISGFIPGAGISIGLYALTRQATNLPLFMTGLRAIQVLILTFIMCMISGIIATHKVQSADPADMF